MQTGVCAAQTGLGVSESRQVSVSVSPSLGRLWAPWGKMRANGRAEGRQGGLDDEARGGAPLELTWVLAVLPLAQLCSRFWASVQITSGRPSPPLRRSASPRRFIPNGDVSGVRPLPVPSQLSPGEERPALNSVPHDLAQSCASPNRSPVSNKVSTHQCFLGTQANTGGYNLMDCWQCCYGNQYMD